MNSEALNGTVLGTCTLQKAIGRGSMGTVFLAQQARPHRQVAVKVLLSMTSLTSSQRADFLERFRREIDAAAALEHPNILLVYAYGERDGVAYLVMPYVSGQSLHNVIEREGPLPLAKVVGYLDQLAAALDFAHEQNVMHGAIKPTNMLLTSEDKVLLADFGLMKVVTHGQTPQMCLTGKGALVTMAAYIAPEQVLGKAVDRRADLYSLGVVVYQMVTGKTPFQGEAPTQIAAQHMKVPPPSPCTLRTDLPLSVEQVMLRAIAKRPSARYERAQDFASAFRAALTVTAVHLDSTPGETLLSKRAPENHLFTQHNLFDPAWQTTMTPSGGHSEDTKKPQSNDTLAAKDVALVEKDLSKAKPAPSSSTEALSPSTVTPLTPIPSRPKLITSQPDPTMRKTLVVLNGDQSDTNTLSTTGSSTPNAEQGARGSWPRLVSKLNPISPLPAIPKDEQGKGVTGALPGATGTTTAKLDPLSPFPSSNVTGALIIPGSEQGNTSTMKLTGAVKVVQMPVAGQPGRYVTGLLPVLPSPLLAEEPLAPTKSDLRQHWKLIALALLVLLVVLGSTTFWFIHTYSNPSHVTKDGIHSEAVTPNVTAIAAAQITATARANNLLVDPLTQNIHNWPVASSGTRLYMFENGAYHITDNDDRYSATSILPGANFSSPLGYSLTMEEIKGDDTSLNNSFGMIFGFSNHQSDNRTITTFYCFEVVNMKTGNYQILKYDDSKGSAVSPWKQIWHHAFGNEFHEGNGPHSVNTFKILMSGSNIIFTVNGKTVGNVQNSSIPSGKIGMLVNLKGTEVAFSNLRLTHN